MTRPMSDSEICDLTDALSGALNDAVDRIAKLEQTVSIYGDMLDDLRNKVYALEHGTPQARQLQYEADVAVADARGYDHHGRNCGCPYCGTDEDEIDYRSELAGGITEAAPEPSPPATGETR